jgi:hypothetical protein
LPCENPRHTEHVANFIKKYPRQREGLPDTIIIVDPKDWVISLEDPKMNTTECCQVCSISKPTVIGEASTRMLEEALEIAISVLSNRSI